MKKGKRFRKIEKKEVHIKIINPRILWLVAIIAIISTISGIFAYFTSTTSISNPFTIRAEYTVTFHANGGTGTMSAQTISYNVPTQLNENTFTKTEYVFNSWNTAADGSGTCYLDEEVVTNLVSGNATNIDLYAQWQPENAVAEMDGVIYTSLIEPIALVQVNGPQKTIKLLRDITIAEAGDMIEITAGKDFILNMQGHEINVTLGDEFLENYGSINIKNGTITNTTGSAAVNNFANASMILDGVNVYMTKNNGKQAVNNEGMLEIKGGSYLSSVSPSAGDKSRGTLENKATVVIKDATIVAVNNKGIVNKGTLTIGEKDGNVNKNSPVIQGPVAGIESTTDFDMYDGTIKGFTDIVIGTGSVDDIETGYDIVSSSEIISGQTYKTMYLGHGVNVTFNPNGGTVSETTRMVEVGSNIGPLPTPTYGTNIFRGWFTDPVNGTQINENTIINAAITYYAHWADVLYVAEYNGTEYKTVQAAINACKNDGTLCTVTILENVSEALTVAAGKNISFNITGHTISNKNNSPVIVVRGQATISNGRIHSSATQGAINVEGNGKLYVTGGTIEAVGTRQAIYNNGGTVEISGNPLLSALSTERATVHNLNNGTMIITGGTIFSENERGLFNAAGTVTIGAQDSNVSTTTPVIQGHTYGVDNAGTFNFYDGILKGTTAGINGTVSDIENGYQVTNGTEQIDGVTYYTSYLDL